ncbi:MAG TPA: RNA polymerase sigma-70 factor [Mucilaginibacter sp.]|jgi:RNA polymerase sigma-70 factor (ECF subfamily)|nr:RNA polymerase sigma-70 factor [Mucilaginibacter sp.]
MNLSGQDILFLQNRVAYLRDQKAYKDLFFHFYTSLYRFAYNLTRNPEISEEIVSDVMMNIWDLDAKLAQVEKLNLYLFTSVKNSALTYLTKNRAEQLVIDEKIENSVFNKNDNPEYYLLLSEIEQKIEASVKSLPPQCQMVYRLIKEEGFSYKEVSTTLQISQNTIETHMRIALKKIRLALDQYLVGK